MKKSIFPIIHSPHCSGKLEWRLEAVGGGIACGSRDGLKVSQTSRWCRQSSGKVGGKDLEVHTKRCTPQGVDLEVHPNIFSYRHFL